MNCDHLEVAENNCVYRDVIQHYILLMSPTLPRTKAVCPVLHVVMERLYFIIRELLAGEKKSWSNSAKRMGKKEGYGGGGRLRNAERQWRGGSMAKGVGSDEDEGKR
nr:DNA-directed RNA polymerases II, IV and V subunit 9A [Ipomoea batatas]